MKYFKRLPVILSVLYYFISQAYSQPVTTVPVYPTDLSPCTVIFDATQGNGELKNVSPPIYAHTGVITNLSSSETDWKYVIAGWTQNTPKALMTLVGNNLYQIIIQPSIREFYGVPENETILKIAFVFRNADGSKVGRDTDGSDIYADVYSASVFTLNILKPEKNALFVNPGDIIPVEAASPMADTMKMTVNGTVVKTVPGTALSGTITVPSGLSYWQKQWVKIIAKNDTAERADSFFFAVIPAPEVRPYPAGITDGINYIDTSKVILSLYAPGKSNCFIIGDFNNWQVDSSGYMYRTPDGNRFWRAVENLDRGKEYIFQYLVDGTLRIADPYSDKISDPDDKYISPLTYPGLIPYPAGKTTEIASVLQTDQQPYPWEVNDFTPPQVTGLVIYELLLRDFTVAHDYPSLIDTLGYLKRLGINAIELMPVMEFEGNISWGYNPDFLFAPDKYYGTREGLKQFIDAAHKEGIAVILDIVLNHHFGKSPLVRLYWDGVNNRPAADNPWFNPVPKHPYNVGYDFNHQSPQTVDYCKRALKYWITEYKVDGFRFDLSKGFTQKNSYPDNVSLWGQYDAGRINILNMYHAAVLSADPDAILILEHFADNSEEKVLSGNGMLLWGNMNYNYNEATMGWNANSDFSWISYLERGWSDPFVVGYMESHDEERLAFKNIKYGNSANIWHDVKDTTISMERLKMAAAFFLTVPGPKMIWQFGETGYDYSINYPSGTSDSRLAPKPIRWDYYSQWRRKHLYDTYASLIDLRRSNEAFSTNDFSMSVSGPFKKMHLNHQEMDVTIIGNFDINPGSINPSFQKAGKWYDYFSGDSIQVAGTSDPIGLMPGEFHIFTTKKLVKPLFTSVEEPGHNNDNDISGVTIFPNPSQGTFRITVDLREPSPVQIMIFDIMGKALYTESREISPAGTTLFSWNVISSGGEKVNPGVYFCRISTGRSVEIKKMILQ